MSKQFRVKQNQKQWLPAWFLVIALFILCCVLFELYKVLIPLQSDNPLWHEVTINEPVIDDWRYGGQNEVGYLRFYNDSNHSIVLPPGERTFDADGKFVVIEDSSPSSLTFAEPIAAIPSRWIFVCLGAVSLVAVLMTWRVKSILKARTRSFHHQAPAVSKLKLGVSSQKAHTQKRFKSKKKLF